MLFRSVKLGWALVILAVGYALHALEIWGLGQIKLKQRVDYVFATVIIGLGVFLVGKATWKPLDWKPLASLGKYSLGIYAMHVLVAGWIHYTFKQTLNEEGYQFFKSYLYVFLTVGTLIVCTVVTWVLTKVPVLKRLV